MASQSEDADIPVDCVAIKEKFNILKKGFYKDHIVLGQNKSTQERVLLVRLKTDDFEIEQRKNCIRSLIFMCKNHRLPGMVQFESIVQDKLDVFLVQKFNEFGVLKNLIAEAYSKGKPFKEDFVKVWLAYLVTAVYHLHKRRVLHGNLHAANIYMDADALHVGPVEGFSRVLEDPKSFAGKGDFWKSIEMDDLERANYMSPEIKAGNMPGPPNDIWCIGVLAHFMTTMTFPFQSSTPDKVLMKVIRNPPTFHNFESYNFSEDLKLWISSCLHKDPKDRPTITKLYESDYLKDTIQKIFAPHSNEQTKK